ncbi:helix-turn-helix domain-containing protein [Mucilaginibacter sp. HD30]
MKIEKFSPDKILRPYIESFMIIESDDQITNRILPEPILTIGFRFKGNTFGGLSADEKMPAASITGVSKTLRLIRYEANSGVLIVRFKEGGALAFCKEPLNELSGLSVSLDEVMDTASIMKTEDLLGSTSTNAERISVIEQFLLSNLHPSVFDPRVSAAVNLIKSLNGNLRIKELASNLSTNVNSLEKHFRAQMGISPKQYASISRLKAVIKDYRAEADLTEISYNAGFFDQSHFIKEFKAFTGENPLRFFRNGIYW